MSKQPAGKLCCIGICIYQAEFDGIRINWRHSF